MKLKKIICFCMVFFLLLPAQVTAETAPDLQDTADYLISAVPSPGFGTTGGEWLILALSRSESEVPESYYELYYQNVCAYVSQQKGILHDKKYTEYARLVLALTAIGKNPQDVAGYNVLEPLADYENVIWQGMNGPVFALLALDSKNYEMPVCATAKTQATRQMYIDYILSNQMQNGAFSLTGTLTPDPDITAMTVCALSKYRTDERVCLAIDKALSFLSEIQNEQGGFSALGEQNIETTAQVLTMLSMLQLPVSDARFVKNNMTVLDNLLSYRLENGAFSHTQENNAANLMSTEQALYALAAEYRFRTGKNTLYDMTDVHFSESNSASSTEGLPGKIPEVKKAEIVYEDKTFSDISGTEYQKQVEALAMRNIINGKTDIQFDPTAAMTRAEFAAITVKALGLPFSDAQIFEDVMPSDWYFPYIAAAYQFGIVNGVSETAFQPNGTITKEEAAVMVARSAVLCGIPTQKTEEQIRNVLAQFLDYKSVQEWSEDALAFCYELDILPQSDLYIYPNQPVKRFEIACMLYQLLSSAALL